MDIFFGADNVALVGDYSSPVIIGRCGRAGAVRADQANFSSGLRWKDVSTKRTMPAYCLLMRESGEH